eukprot:715251-Hanusia_phi.AAC.1
MDSPRPLGRQRRACVLGVIVPSDCLRHRSDVHDLANIPWMLNVTEVLTMFIRWHHNDRQWTQHVYLPQQSDCTMFDATKNRPVSQESTSKHGLCVWFRHKSIVTVGVE